MRATVTIEDEMVNDLMIMTGARTRTQAVNQALTDYVRLRRIEALRAMRGRTVFYLDVAALRDQDADKLEKLHGCGPR